MASDTALGDVPFSLEEGHFIVVRGEAHGGRTLRFIIDTGASRSLLDSDAVIDLGLELMTGSVTVDAFGNTVQAEWVVLSGLSLGSSKTSLACLVVDLPWEGIDGLIGLDLLRRRNLTIDFENQRISFGGQLNLASEVTFLPDLPLVLVTVKLKGRELLLSVDTGSRGISLFGPVQGVVARRPVSFTAHRQVDITGSRPVKQVEFATMELGDGRWRGLRGVVHRVVPEHDRLRDGVLGVAALGLRRLHFDFGRHVVGWER